MNKIGYRQKQIFWHISLNVIMLQQIGISAQNIIVLVGPKEKDKANRMLVLHRFTPKYLRVNIIHE